MRGHLLSGGGESAGGKSASQEEGSWLGEDLLSGRGESLSESQKVVTLLKITFLFNLFQKSPKTYTFCPIHLNIK